MQPVEQRLRQAGLRATRVRCAVMSLLEQKGGPLGVSVIRSKLRSEVPDLATIYRNLAVLELAGLVKKVNIAEGAASFESAGLPHHHHLICDRCGDVEELTGCVVKRAPANQRFARVTRHSLKFAGICKRCAAD